MIDQGDFQVLAERILEDKRALEDRLLKLRWPKVMSGPDELCLEVSRFLPEPAKVNLLTA